MEALIHFVKQHQKRITLTTRIILRIGKSFDSTHVLDCRCSPDVCRTIVTKLGNNTSITYSCTIEHVYRDHELEYLVHSKGENNYTVTTLETSQPIEGLRAMLQETETLALEDFPNRTEYHDEFHRNRHIFDYGGLLEIHIITEDRDKSCVHMIEIHITKHNLYETPLFEALEKVIGVIEGVEGSPLHLTGKSLIPSATPPPTPPPTPPLST